MLPRNRKRKSPSLSQWSGPPKKYAKCTPCVSLARCRLHAEFDITDFHFEDVYEISQRGRLWWLGAIAATLVASLAALLSRPMLEHAVLARIESAAVRHGMVARIGLVPRRRAPWSTS